MPMTPRHREVSKNWASSALQICSYSSQGRGSAGPCVVPLADCVRG